jgi:hypothetical protein
LLGAGEAMLLRNRLSYRRAIYRTPFAGFER